MSQGRFKVMSPQMDPGMVRAMWRLQGRAHVQQATGQHSPERKYNNIAMLVAALLFGLCNVLARIEAKPFVGPSWRVSRPHVIRFGLQRIEKRRGDFFQACTLQAASQNAERTSMKEEFLSLVASSNRARDKSKDEAIINAFQMLEQMNPCVAPLESPLLKGEWELIWTTSDSILGLSRPWLFRPRSRKPILQYLDPSKGFARNLEYTPLGKNRVEASIVPLDENQVEDFTNRSPRKGPKYKIDNSPGGTYLPKGEDVRSNTVGVKFNKFIILGLIRVKAPEKARGILQVTYLDDDLRLSRGDRGNLFVLRKVGDEMVK